NARYDIVNLLITKNLLYHELMVWSREGFLNDTSIAVKNVMPSYAIFLDPLQEISNQELEIGYTSKIFREKVDKFIDKMPKLYDLLYDKLDKNNIYVDYGLESSLYDLLRTAKNFAFLSLSDANWAAFTEFYKNFQVITDVWEDTKEEVFGLMNDM